MNRLEGEFDAVLNLQDRQVIDVDGHLVCKVDDVLLAQADDDAVQVRGILVGPAALLPRFSGRIGRRLLELWRLLGIEQHGRTTPLFLGLDRVREVDTSVLLNVSGDGLLVPAPTGDRLYRLDQLLGMTVEHGSRALGRVLDVRVTPEGDRLVCTHLIVGRGRPGSMLGYDRGGDRGPAPLSHLIRWLHRHSGQIAFARITDLDWDAGTIAVDEGLATLTHA